MSKFNFNFFTTVQNASNKKVADGDDEESGDDEGQHPNAILHG